MVRRKLGLYLMGAAAVCMIAGCSANEEQRNCETWSGRPLSVPARAAAASTTAAASATAATSSSAAAAGEANPAWRAL